MLYLVKKLFAPISSLIVTMVASGLLSTFVAVELDILGYNPRLIGSITSVFYVGVLLGAFKAPKLIFRLGHSRSLMALYAINAAAILFHSFWLNPYYWMGLRLIIGISLGGFFTVIESWFLRESVPTERSQSFALCFLFYYAALAGGQLLLNVTVPFHLDPFCVAGSLSAFAVFPLAIFGSDPVSHAPPITLKVIKKTLPAPPIGFTGGVVSGMIIASIYGLAPVFAKSVGFSIEQVSFVMAMILCGGCLLQWPIGKCADHCKRSKMLGIVFFLTALLSWSIGWYVKIPFELLLALLWIFGGLSFSLYPLSMAYLCEGIEEEGLPSTTSKFIFSYGIGAISGPLIAPFFMNWFGPSGLFFFMAAITAFFAIIPLIPRKGISS